ncbi:MAG: class I SAM-dependent methyltransferase [Bacteroidota bacterium]
MFDNQNLRDPLIKPMGYYNRCRPEMMDFIPHSAKTILDIGCGEGLFGRQLKQKINAEVWGIEIDKTAGALAQTIIDKVYIGDIVRLIDDIPNNFFDCIVFNDVLEHLVDPFYILLRIKDKLTKDGVVVSSIPNVRYYYTLKDLLIKKQWKYEDEGILDKTHLRFFTLLSIVEMFKSLDYEIKTIKGINPIKSWKLVLLNILSFGYLSDIKYLQFACVTKPK